MKKTAIALFGCLVASACAPVATQPKTQSSTTTEKRVELTPRDRAVQLCRDEALARLAKLTWNATVRADRIYNPNTDIFIIEGTAAGTGSRKPEDRQYFRFRCEVVAGDVIAMSVEQNKI